MIEKEQEAHFCHECEAEFIIHTPYDTDQLISFCPFCGSEIENLDEDFDEDEEDDN